MRSLLFVLQVISAGVGGPPPPAAAQQGGGTEFAALIARLSEPGGYFDSDNLVSNETSYLHVIPALRALEVRGGAYLGVGPEQNFSYLAEIKPDLAILIDIRRDNMLLHLLLKAMFESARNRMEYLCLLYGRPAPPDPRRWTDAPLEDILTYLDITPGDSASYAGSHAALMERVIRYGVPIADSDRATLGRFHDEFFHSGLEITFTSRGRPSRPGYPSERQLYLSLDLDGRPSSYLATEDRFRTVRELERRNRVIPVVGDLSGPVAMKAIAGYLREKGLRVSAFYVSNVEMYLFRQGSFARYAENVRALPSGPNSVIVRSVFGRGWPGPAGGAVGGAGGGSRGDSGPVIPQALPGHLSAQLLQTFPVFLKLTVRPDSVSYWDILTGAAVDLRAPVPGGGRPRQRRRGRPRPRPRAQSARRGRALGPAPDRSA
jgi:hypothetical protein